jgi:hypothetical protein
MDKGVEYEQNLKRRSIAIMIVRAELNRLVDFVPLVQDCVRQMGSIKRTRLFELADEVAFLYAFCMHQSEMYPF